MSEAKHFNIHLGPTIRHTEAYVEMDGERLTNLCGVDVHAHLGKATKVVLTFVNVDVNFDMPAAVDVSDADDTHKRFVLTALPDDLAA